MGILLDSCVHGCNLMDSHPFSLPRLSIPLDTITSVVEGTGSRDSHHLARPNRAVGAPLPSSKGSKYLFIYGYNLMDDTHSIVSFWMFHWAGDASPRQDIYNHRCADNGRYSQNRFQQTTECNCNQPHLVNITRQRDDHPKRTSRSCTRKSTVGSDYNDNAGFPRSAT